MSRQIANLKQTLRHTTENTMQLDTTIEQRKREINNVSNDINAEKDQNEQERQALRQGQVDLLNQQIEKAKVLYQGNKMKTLATRYDQVATDQFQAQTDADAGQVLESEAQRNQVIEQVINRCREQNPNMAELLSKFTEW